jgi:hypothetical protein
MEQEPYHYPLDRFLHYHYIPDLLPEKQTAIFSFLSLSMSPQPPTKNKTKK